MSNTRLWDSVKETKPENSKKTSNGRFSFTAVDPTSQTLRATELWGPYGDKWGIRDLKWSSVSIDGMTNYQLDAMFFYPSEDGREISFPYSVDLKLRPGDDTCKKLHTTLKSKCLSLLGFNSDVFMGKFDDVAYVEAMERKYGDQEVLLAGVLGKIKTAKTQTELDEYQAKIESIAAGDSAPQSSIDRMTDAVAQRRQEIGKTRK